MQPPFQDTTLWEGGGIIMSHKDNAKKGNLFSFLTTFVFTLLLTLGVVFSYVKSFLPDLVPYPCLFAAIISSALFSFILQFKKRGYIFLLSLLTLVVTVIIKWEMFFQSAGSTFLPLYASYMKDPGITEVYTFKESSVFFITIFVIFLSLITAAVLIFNLPAIFSLVFPFAVIIVAIFFSNEFIDPFSFMLLVSSSVIFLIDRRGLVSVGPGAPKSALISAVILLLLSVILNAVIKPVSYVQSEGAQKARLSLEDFILEHTPFYIDVNTGNLQFGNSSGNMYSWIKNEEYADISGGSLLGNKRSFDRIEPPEIYPAYIKINEYSDYDGRGWAKSGGSDELVPDNTREALRDISYEISLRLDEEEPGAYSYPGNDVIIDIPELSDLIDFSAYTYNYYPADMIADAVKEYVSNAAVYDKGIETPPPDVDIADYFLHVSKRGYCIHFATAATLLLRMQGIPARFVTGYLVNARPTGSDGKIEITGNDAHAWCEYYDASEDLWKILEATPPDPTSTSTSSGEYYQSHEREKASVNPSGEVDDSDPDDIDDDEDDDKKEETPSEDGEADAKKDSENKYREKLAENGRTTWIVIITIGSLAVSLFLLFFIGRGLYRRNLKTGSAKKRIIKYYRAIRIERGLNKVRVKIPDEVSDIVMKARFSSHEMTAEELDTVKKYYESIHLSSG